MWFKLIHCLVLFSYLNILTYEVGINREPMPQALILNGESLLEFVLDDVLDIPIDSEGEDVEIIYDDYRTTSIQYQIIPILIFLLGCIFAVALSAKPNAHPYYSGNRQIAPGYYTFLYRYSLF